MSREWLGLLLFLDREEGGVEAEEDGEDADGDRPEAPRVPREDANEGRQLDAEVGDRFVDEDLVPRIELGFRLDLRARLGLTRRR